MFDGETVLESVPQVAIEQDLARLSFLSQDAFGVSAWIREARSKY
jgi:hypothetical protein